MDIFRFYSFVSLSLREIYFGLSIFTQIKIIKKPQDSLYNANICVKKIKKKEMKLIYLFSDASSNFFVEFKTYKINHLIVVHSKLDNKNIKKPSYAIEPTALYIQNSSKLLGEAIF